MWHDAMTKTQRQYANKHCYEAIEWQNQIFVFIAIVQASIPYESDRIYFFNSCTMLW